MNTYLYIVRRLNLVIAGAMIAQKHIASLWAILGRDPKPEIEEAKRLARSSGMSINESLGIIEARAAVGIDHNNGDGVSHE